MKKISKEERYEIGNRVSKITATLNTFLALFKFIAGVLAGSTAMIADAIHSASDVFTTVVVIISLKIAKRPADESHPYGHEKAESIAAKMLSILLFAAGLGIGWTAIQSIWKGTTHIPGAIALYAAIASIISQESMYWYTIIAAKRIKSTALQADAWHHRSDAFSSVGTLIGIAGARMGFPILDPLAGLIVSLFILKISVDIYIKSVKELMDTSVNKDELDQIRETVLSTVGVQGIDNMRTRIHASEIYVDLAITVDHFISVEDGHSIASSVRDAILQAHEIVKDVFVHVNPCGHEMEKGCITCSHPCPYQGKA